MHFRLDHINYILTKKHIQEENRNDEIIEAKQNNQAFLLLH